MDKKWYIVGGIVLVLVISFFRNRETTENTGDTTPTPTSEIITQEDGTVVKKTGDLVEQVSEEEKAQTKLDIDAKVADGQAADLIVENGQVGMGKSYRKLDGGSYFQKIELEGMTPLEKGYFYQAWLENEAGTRISIGRVEMTGANGTVYYMAKEDKTAFKFIIISQEIEDGNEAMGEVILRGKYE